MKVDVHWTLISDVGSPGISGAGIQIQVVWDRWRALQSADENVIIERMDQQNVTPDFVASSRLLLHSIPEEMQFLLA